MYPLTAKQFSEGILMLGQVLRADSNADQAIMTTIAQQVDAAAHDMPAANETTASARNCETAIAANRLQANSRDWRHHEGPIPTPRPVWMLIH
jgi:hypothetical protein